MESIAQRLFGDFVTCAISRLPMWEKAHLGAQNAGDAFRNALGRLAKPTLLQLLSDCVAELYRDGGFRAHVCERTREP